ncbi:MAG: M13 family metallopeptidase, partial [bacterium]
AAKNANAPRGSNLQKIGGFYATGMDSAKIEAEGMTPIAADLTRVAALQSPDELQKEIAWFHQYTVPAIFNFFSGDDDKNSTQVIAQIYQGGLGLPDRDYYFNQDERTQKIREDYLQHIAAMLRLAGDDSVTATASAKTVMAIEKQLAQASSTNVELRDSEKNYNKLTPEKLAALAPELNWKNYYANLGIAAPKEINVGQPKFMQAAAEMLKTVPLAEWKVYLRWHLVSNAAPFLSSSFVNENFKFYGTTLTGAKELQPRWRRVKDVTDGLLGEALGELFVAKKFSPEAKARCKEMVNNLIAAYRSRILRLDWMDDATRQAALHKLSTFGVKIGYPDIWRDYSALEIDRTSYFENLKRATLFETRRQLSKIDKPIDRNEWIMTPPAVNAYYRSTRNEIVFPAGVLQPPFFDAHADDAVNYGGIGAVIGHELTHGFDDEGSKYDAEGNLKSWWSPEVRKNFEERAQMVVEQFNNFLAIDTLHVNGKLTLGENIADLGGLAIAYEGLMKALENKRVQPLDGFTPEQRFFLSWAQIWRVNYRPESMRLQVLTNVHAPGNFRVLGPLANMPEFYLAFSVAETDAMFQPEAQRSKIW